LPASSPQQSCGVFRRIKFRRCKILADKGYDSGLAREFVIENIGAECQIPIKGKLGRHPGFYRKRFVKDGKKYHQRSKTETVFGEAVRAKKWIMQKKELLLRFICYNLYGISEKIRGFTLAFLGGFGCNPVT